MRFWSRYLVFTEYVLEMEGNMVANTRIIINRQWNLEEEQITQRRPTSTERDSQNLQESSRATIFDDEEENMLALLLFLWGFLSILWVCLGYSWFLFILHRTYHEIAHRRSEQRLNNLKWPWERLINVSQDDGADDPDAYKFTDKEMYDKYK